MRLDARDGHRASVYDAKRCCSPKHVVWVDDQTAQWGHSLNRLNAVRELDIEVVQEDRITIYLARGLIIFNEIDDGEETKGIYIHGSLGHYVNWKIVALGS